MVMCIISAVFTLPLLISAAVGIANDNDRVFCNYYPYYSCKTVSIFMSQWRFKAPTLGSVVGWGCIFGSKLVRQTSSIPRLFFFI